MATGRRALEVQVGSRSTLRKPSSSRGTRIGSGGEVSEVKTLSAAFPDPPHRGRAAVPTPV